MPHLSENSTRLKISKESSVRFVERADNFNDVCLIRLPEIKSSNIHPTDTSAYRCIAEIAKKIGQNATLILVGENPDLVHVHAEIALEIRYQLWVSIKRKTSQSSFTHSALNNYHFGATIYSKYSGSIKHTKTRIAYSFCPACDKTTKDYGGKKHTYHEYGTLMSDVWRDIAVDFGGDISPLIDRFADLFGIIGYKKLVFVDLIADRSNTQKQVLAPEHSSNPGTIRTRSRLINGDCLRELKRIPDNSIDFAFADPPYNLRKKYSGYNDALEISEYFDWCDKWLSEMARTLKPGRTLAVLNIPLWSIRHFLFLEKHMNFQNWIVWEALSFPVRLIMPAHYTILCFSKGPARRLNGLNSIHVSNVFENQTPIVYEPLGEQFCLRKNCIEARFKSGFKDRGPLTDLWWDIHRLKHNTRRVDHPCQVPPQLMYRLISIFTNSGEAVLDCFNGAGTTTLAANQLNRRYIGIEAASQYHKLALSRHQEIKAGIDPFRKLERILKAKNSPVPRLMKQKYDIPKKTLQLEVKRVASILGRVPTREELIKHGNYPIDYYDRYFVSWGEVCAAARTTGMSESRVNACNSSPVAQTVG